MNSSPTCTQTAKALADGSTSQNTDENTEFYRAALHELIGLGTDLARRIHAAATSEPPLLTLAEAGIAFDRVARTLRRTILLAHRLHELRHTPDAATSKSATSRTAARKRLIREVEDVIGRTPPAGRQALHTEFHERLDAPDLEDDLATRPIAEIIIEICRDLAISVSPGMSHPWKRRTPQDIATMVALAAAQPAAAQPAAARPATARPPAPHPSIITNPRPSDRPPPRSPP